MHINCSEYNLHALNSSFITDIIYGKMALLRVPIPYMYIASSSSFFPLNWCISVKISTHFAILLRIARQIYCAWSASVDFGGTGGGGRGKVGGGSLFVIVYLLPSVQNSFTNSSDLIEGSSLNSRLHPRAELQAPSLFSTAFNLTTMRRGSRDSLLVRTPD